MSEADNQVNYYISTPAAVGDVGVTVRMKGVTRWTWPGWRIASLPAAVVSAASCHSKTCTSETRSFGTRSAGGERWSSCPDRTGTQTRSTDSFRRCCRGSGRPRACWAESLCVVRGGSNGHRTATATSSGKLPVAAGVHNGGFAHSLFRCVPRWRQSTHRFRVILDASVLATPQW